MLAPLSHWRRALKQTGRPIRLARSNRGYLHRPRQCLNACLCGFVEPCNTKSHRSPFQHLCHIGPDDGGSGYSIVLSFRPIVLVWCPTENSKSWMLGFTAIMMAVNGIRHTLTRSLEGPVFALCCADGAQAGYRGFRGVFPLGRWIQCWVHVTRNPKTKWCCFARGPPQVKFKFNIST